MTNGLHRINDWPERARKACYSVARLARLCGVSCRTLERHFAQTLAMTPQKWLHLQRLKQATSVLDECASIKEAAGLLGYRQQSHFARDFKQYHGTPPRNFSAREGSTLNSPPPL